MKTYSTFLSWQAGKIIIGGLLALVFVAVSKNNEVHFSFMFLFLSLTLTLVMHYFHYPLTLNFLFWNAVLFFIFWGKSYHILHCQIFSGYGLCNENMHESVKWAKESTKKVYKIDQLIMHLKKVLYSHPLVLSFWKLSISSVFSWHHFAKEGLITSLNWKVKK